MGLEKTVANALHLFERGVLALEKIATALGDMPGPADQALNRATAEAVVRAEGAKQDKADEKATQVETRKAAEKPAREEPAPEKKPEGKRVSIDEVRQALGAFGKREGSPAAIELLGKFGAKKISDLGAEDYAAVIEACQ